MFQLGKTIISEQILDADFACNLSACKGACCVDGDAGAPLEHNETEKLKAIYPKIKSYLRPQGIEAIERQGTFVTNEEGEFETPLVDGADCAYVIFDEKQTALCGIEEAYNQGDIDWKKPVSCDDACALGKELQIPIYKFVKEALIRKFGEQWYIALEKIAKDRSVQ